MQFLCFFQYIISIHTDVVRICLVIPSIKLSKILGVNKQYSKYNNERHCILTAHTNYNSNGIVPSRKETIILNSFSGILKLEKICFFSILFFSFYWHILNQDWTKICIYCYRTKMFTIEVKSKLLNKSKFICLLNKINQLHKSQIN